MACATVSRLLASGTIACMIEGLIELVTPIQPPGLMDLSQHSAPRGPALFMGVPGGPILWAISPASQTAQ